MHGMKGVSLGDIEKWLDSVYVLKTEPTGSPDRLDMEQEKKMKVKSDPSILA